MKILIISGDGDYAACAFEESGMTVEEAAKKVEAGEELSEDGEFEGRVLEFGEVDPKFVEWVKNEVVDYDDGKHTAFYVVNES